MKTIDHDLDGVEVEPLIPTAQRRFMQGQLSADVYVRLGEEAEERKAQSELAYERHRQFRRLMIPFSLLGFVAYAATGLVYLLGNSRLGAIIAAVSSVVCLVIAALTASAQRVDRRRRRRASLAVITRLSTR